MNGKSAIARLNLLCWWLRQVLGDAAYENYLRSARSGASPLMSREEFFLDSLRRRYSTISRCC
jgi:uncharacterized short protein YbdD (DUF466 family)